jgi:hypothetical protein
MIILKDATNSDVPARLGLKAGAQARLRRARAFCLLEPGRLIGLRLGPGLGRARAGAYYIQVGTRRETENKNARLKETARD